MTVMYMSSTLIIFEIDEQSFGTLLKLVQPKLTFNHLKSIKAMDTESLHYSIATMENHIKYLRYRPIRDPE